VVDKSAERPPISGKRRRAVSSAEICEAVNGETLFVRPPFLPMRSSSTRKERSGPGSPAHIA